MPLSEVAVMKTPNPNGLIPTSIVPNIERNGATKEDARPMSRLQPSNTRNPGLRRKARAGMRKRCMRAGRSLGPAGADPADGGWSGRGARWIRRARAADSADDAGRAAAHDLLHF